MSKLLDRFRYFKTKGDSFANGHGQVYNTNRDWEDGYRQRWQFDKIVRSMWGGDRFCMVVMWGKKGAEAMNDGGCEAR
ncbi:hypothetical protein N8Q82_20080 [Enterobacter roggenkampii]|nr:hypothetical protein [Enterobacter roggenkampii]MCU2348295.1 hypothetical protein [Enterobacter roggenkampii]